jgi:hypothetical protein
MSLVIFGSRRRGRGMRWRRRMKGGGEGEEEVVGGWTVRARRVEGRMGRKGGARTLGAALREASEEL